MGVTTQDSAAADGRGLLSIIAEVIPESASPDTVIPEKMDDSPVPELVTESIHVAAPCVDKISTIDECNCNSCCLPNCYSPDCKPGPRCNQTQGDSFGLRRLLGSVDNQTACMLTCGL